ncbi:MAG: hypothetical protein GY724_05685 [Actinomycetia bacterium]|nr:hypothetical protein [Actinomycetes bacterium]
MSDLPSVEVTDEALGDITRQLDPDTAWSFTRLDMLPALGAMAARWPDLPEVQGAPGRRYTADGLTVAGWLPVGAATGRTLFWLRLRWCGCDRG